MSADSLHEIVFNFEKESPIERWIGPAAQAWLLNWIRSRDPALAAALHDANGRKPYTVGGREQVRVTLLDSKLLPLLNEEPPLRVNGVAYPLVRASYRQSSLSELIRNVEADPPLPRLELRSPVVFRSAGEDVIMPTPELTFGSLIRAWDSFSPLPLPVQLNEIVTQQVRIARYHLRSVGVRVPHKGARFGCVGWVDFEILDGVPQDAQRLLTALLAFAEYAGLGAGTTAGFGQVRAVV